MGRKRLPPPLPLPIFPSLPRFKFTAGCKDSFPYLPQGPGDLGDRMTRVIEEAFAAGADRVIVVGTDCPGITSALAEEAFERLATADIVLGPATDGGYYLIGLRRPIRALFAGIAWGQETVLQETKKRAAELGLATSLLTALSDVDRPEDLPVWPRARGDSLSASSPPRISVIIPALNEARYLDGTLSALQGARNIETIVVDGGSCDGTDSLALDRGASLVRSADRCCGRVPPAHRREASNIPLDRVDGESAVAMAANALRRSNDFPPVGHIPSVGPVSRTADHGGLRIHPSASAT